MKLRRTLQAERDRNAIWAHIAADNPRAAAKIDALSTATSRRLLKHPFMGRPGKITGTREPIPHETYRPIHQPGGETVWILAIVHTSRPWPPVHGL